MPDQRSVLKEYRALEQKRLAQGLTPAEDRRHAELRALVGSDPSAGGPARGGFDVNAAAAKLRESLLPAGLRNRPPPAPEVVEPEQISPPEPEPAPEQAALESAYQEQAFAPLETSPADALFEPSSLGTEGDPNAQPYDPNAAYPEGYDPNAAQAAWDPNAAYDPNAQPYDPNAAYPEGYDPSAAQAAWDPNAAYDPNAQPYDPNAPGHDPAAQAWDAQPGGGFDPASLAGEPAAAAFHGAPAPLDLDGGPEFAPAADADGAQGDWATAAASAPAAGAEEAYPPDELDDPYAMIPSSAFESSTEPEPPPPEAPPTLELGEYDGAGPVSFAPLPEEDGTLPFDAAAASAIDPTQLPEGFEAVPGEYDDNAGFGVTGYEAPPTAHLGDAALSEAAPSWQPENALDQGFALASGGSFDAAADAAAPAWAGGTPEQSIPWEARQELTDPEAEPDLGPAPELDHSAPNLSGDDPADDFFAISAPPLALGGPSALDAPAAARAPAPATRAPAPASAPAARAPVPAPAPAVRAPAPAPAPAARAPAPAPAPAARAPAPSMADVPEAEAEEILEPEEIEEVPEEIVHPPDAHAEAPPDLDFPTAIAEPFAPSPPPAAYAAAEQEHRAPDAPPYPAEDVSFEEEAPAESALVPGSHRVVVHTLEGLVKRGVLEDADLAAPVLGLAPSAGADPEVLGADKVKAIFFMLAPGEAAPVAEGKRVRVTFRDGRQVAGFSPDYREGGIGFFMIPADARTNTGRIWIYRAAVRQVSVS